MDVSDVISTTFTMTDVYISMTRTGRLTRTCHLRPGRAFGSLPKALYILTVATLNLRYRWNYLAAESIGPIGAAYMSRRYACPPCSIADPIAPDCFPAPCMQIICAICWSKRGFRTSRYSRRSTTTESCRSTPLERNCLPFAWPWIPRQTRY